VSVNRIAAAAVIAVAAVLFALTFGFEKMPEGLSGGFGAEAFPRLVLGVIAGLAVLLHRPAGERAADTAHGVLVGRGAFSSWRLTPGRLLPAMFCFSSGWDTVGRAPPVGAAGLCNSPYRRYLGGVRKGVRHPAAAGAFLLMEAFLAGMGLLLDPKILLMVLAGTLLGIIVGALPGISGSTTTALLLPFTITMGPVPAIAFIGAIYCAANFGGSITAILVNSPGDPSASATAFDGYPMAVKGEAGRALGMSALASAIGGIFSASCDHRRAACAPRVLFGPPEYFGSPWPFHGRAHRRRRRSRT
jgi:hypothetical protein